MMHERVVLVVEKLDELQNIIVPGISTEEINKFCYKMIKEMAEFSKLGYPSILGEWPQRNLTPKSCQSCAI